jgi:hypothetical protein
MQLNNKQQSQVIKPEETLKDVVDLDKMVKDVRKEQIVKLEELLEFTTGNLWVEIDQKIKILKAGKPVTK